MFYKTILIIFTLLFFGCSSKIDNNKELYLVVNSWIGYTPLFYLREIGTLKKLNIKLIPTISLDQSSNIFEVDKADMIAATQHEFNSLKSTNDILPIILLDRSNGGDMILSNRSLLELKKTKKIYAYLEIDSINNELLKSFIKKYGLDEDKMEFINIDQLQISKLKNKAEKPMLIVTYSPYNIELRKKGFKELASTKNNNSLLVIDALYIKKSLYPKEKKRLKKLKFLIDKAIDEIKNNPKKVYKYVKVYLNDISYKDFLNSLELIEWINRNRTKELNEKLKNLGFGETILK